MDQYNLQAGDLAEVFGSDAIATEVISSQVEFSMQQVKVLGKFFQVDPGLFL